jgi:hypothetical protein
VNCYLTKPVDRDTLAEELRPILERPLRTVRMNTPAARFW